MPRYTEVSTRTPIAAPMRTRIARPYLVDTTVSEVSVNVSTVPSALVRLRWMTVDPCGAELTGSRTVAGSWAGITTRSWKWRMVSWDVRPGELDTVAATRTRMAWCSPFWIDTGT